ncbi:hypothetical protein P3W45_001001 [Vairimorpha bombi]|jgi:Mrp family chromosome partitioning ATPase
MHKSNKCPTTNLGKSEQCEGCPNQNICGTIKEDESLPGIHKNTSNIRFVVSVMSGKGGVGKSTITRNIGEYLSDLNLRVLILDLDLSGPSMPKMTQTDGEIIVESNMIIYPVQISKNLGCISLGYFTNTDIIYNSSVKTNLIKNILLNSCLDGFDVMVIDTPPNITDEHLAMVNYLKVDYSLIVTTPQKMSFQDVIRQVTFCTKNNIKIMGLIENMKSFRCDGCKHIQNIFHDSNVKEICSSKNIKYLGSLPLNIMYGKESDKGNKIEDPLFNKISHLILEKYNEKNIMGLK